MKHYQDTKTGQIYAFEDNINPYKLNNRNLPIKTLIDNVKEKPNEEYVWYKEDWVHKNQIPKNYSEPISDIPCFSPAWVSFLFPVGTIVVNDSVNLDIDLNQINSNKYNWKEFSKIILSLPDINGNDLPILVTVDGAVMLPNCEKYYSQEIAINEMNKIRGSLFLAGLLIPLIDIKGLEQGSVVEGGGYSFLYKPSFHNRVRLGGTSLSERIVLSHLNKIKTVELTNFYFLGKEYKKNFHFDVDFLVNGYFELLNYNLVSALNNLWIVVEQLTKKIWEKEPKDILKKIAKELKKDQILGRIGVKHEVLNVHKVFSDEVLKILDDARIKRNHLMHDSSLPDLLIIENLWTILFDMIETAYDIKMKELYSRTVSLNEENKKVFIRFNTFYKNTTTNRKRNFDDWKII